MPQYILSLPIYKVYFFCTQAQRKPVAIEDAIENYEAAAYLFAKACGEKDEKTMTMYYNLHELYDQIGDHKTASTYVEKVSILEDIVRNDGGSAGSVSIKPFAANGGSANTHASSASDDKYLGSSYFFKAREFYREKEKPESAAQALNFSLKSVQTLEKHLDSEDDIKYVSELYKTLSELYKDKNNEDAYKASEQA